MISHELPQGHVQNIKNTEPLVTHNIFNLVDLEYTGKVNVGNLEFHEAEKLANVGIVMGIQRAKGNEAALGEIRAEIDQMQRAIPALHKETLIEHIAKTGGE